MPYQEGDTTYNYATGQASTLQRGSDGTLKWSDPVAIPQGSGSGKMPPPPGPSVGVGEDLAKTAGPATERGVTALATSIPTLASGAAQLASKGASYLPPGIGTPIQEGAEATSNFLKPVTYPQVQGKIESAYNQTHPNAPLYYPQTTAGQFLESGIGGGIAAVGGPFSMAKALTGPLAKLGGRLATGVGAGIGSEAAGQIADAADLGPYVSGAARVGGSLIGGREAAERPRKMITPYPAISQAHTNMANLLQKQPGDITTAGQATGNPKLLQKDANLAPYASAPYNNLGVAQPKADTNVMMGAMGVDPATVEKSGATIPVINEGMKAAGARRDTLEGYSGPQSPNTQAIFDPEFHQTVQGIQDDYHRINGSVPDPNDPNPIEKRVAQIYSAGPTSKNTAAGLNGDRYGKLRSDINKQIGGFTKGKNADPLMVRGLSQLRDAMDSNMERSLQAQNSPYAGQWQQNFDQMETGQTLRQAAERPTAAGILDPTTVNAYAKNPNSQIAQLSHAQSTVHKPLPSPNEPGGLIPTMAGALLSHFTGTSSPQEGAIAGSVSGPTITKSLLRNPITAGLHFSPFNQSRLKNQVWPPGPGSTMDPATVARLLALQKTESTPPQEQ